MIGQPRTAGRHRAGQPYTHVHQRVWDGPAHDQAEILERSCPGWVVWYGTGSRRFYAIATWPAPEPVMVQAATAENLEEQMNQAETAQLLHTATFTGRVRRHAPLPGTRCAVRPARGLPYPPEGSAA